MNKTLTNRSDFKRHEKMMNLAKEIAEINVAEMSFTEVSEISCDMPKLLEKTDNNANRELHNKLQKKNQELLKAYKEKKPVIEEVEEVVEGDDYLSKFLRG